MKIGIFGGAFNPVHNGHLRLANAYLKALSLDKILFIPTSVPPHKTSQYLAPAKDRLNMLSLAIKGNDQFDMSDIEFRRSGESYTYDTICELKKIHPDDEFYLIIGSDQFFYFPKWYREKDILDMVTLCTAARENEEYQKLVEFKREHPELEGSIISSIDAFVVSSSDIREKVKENADISSLVPKSVEEYIKEHGLYV